MRANPSGAANFWYGLGLEMGPTVDDYRKAGTLPGTGTLVYHDPQGYSVAILTNTIPDDYGSYHAAMLSLIRTALGSGFTGSTTDLYPQYPSPVLPASHP
jgi:hypothetical protein